MIDTTFRSASPCTVVTVAYLEHAQEAIYTLNDDAIALCCQFEEYLKNTSTCQYISTEELKGLQRFISLDPTVNRQPSEQLRLCEKVAQIKLRVLQKTTHRHSPTCFLKSPTTVTGTSSSTQ